jgi:hypothetical protein
VTTGEPTPELAAATTEAVNDLSTRLGVAPSAIEVVVAEEITWPDGRLGCPDLSLPYTLEPVDGQRVVLGHESRLYHYHFGSEATPVLCESLSERSKGPGTPEPTIPPPIK